MHGKSMVGVPSQFARDPILIYRWNTVTIESTTQFGAGIVRKSKIMRKRVIRFGSIFRLTRKMMRVDVSVYQVAYHVAIKSSTIYFQFDGRISPFIWHSNSVFFSTNTSEQIYLSNESMMADKRTLNAVVSSTFAIHFSTESSKRGERATARNKKRRIWAACNDQIDMRRHGTTRCCCDIN